MGAPKGNKYGLGGKGGRRPDFHVTQKITMFRGLALDFAINVLQTGTHKDKMELVTRGLSRILPSEMILDSKRILIDDDE